MELREALSQIAEIRLQLARTEVFRGYRAVPVAFSGLLALAAAGFQQLFIPQPMQNAAAYLSLWLGAAAISALAAGTEMLLRTRHSASSWTSEVTWLAVSQFLPCLAAGGLLVVVLLLCAPECLWLLPGLWQILFSLGIFASYRLLPRATFAVAVFYMTAGALTLGLARGDDALSPWAMGLPFGLGQLLAAAVLYWTLERNDAEPESQG
jgi:hypothetical protein